MSNWLSRPGSPSLAYFQDSHVSVRSANGTSSLGILKLSCSLLSCAVAFKDRPGSWARCSNSKRGTHALPTEESNGWRLLTRAFWVSRQRSACKPSGVLEPRTLWWAMTDPKSHNLIKDNLRLLPQLLGLLFRCWRPFLGA